MARQERAETLTEEQAGRMLAGMNEVIRAGEEMRELRAELIQLFAGLGWTQDTIARLAEMSQPAVSKQMTKRRGDGPPPVMEVALDQYDVPWLEGRLWGLAEEVSEALDDGARCSPLLHALARGRRRFTPQNVDALRRLLEDDFRVDGARLPPAHRPTYDQISRRLDVPPGRPAPAAVSPAVRRAVAHRVQRDRLRRG